MHHKRKGPKSGRAGCLMCKPHKRQGSKRDERMRHSDARRMVAGRRVRQRSMSYDEYADHYERLNGERVAVRVVEAEKTELDWEIGR